MAAPIAAVRRKPVTRLTMLPRAMIALCRATADPVSSPGGGGPAVMAAPSTSWLPPSPASPSMFTIGSAWVTSWLFGRAAGMTTVASESSESCGRRCAPRLVPVMAETI
jgi:hypothetical protein